MNSRTCVLTAAAAFLVSATPALASPPPNDAFGDALIVKVGREYSGSTVDATAELGEPRHGPSSGPSHSVWFRYRAAHTTRMTVDTGGSSYDTVLAAYTGSNLSHLHLITRDDDSSPSGNLGSTIRFLARRGTTYWFVIDSYARDESGTYKLWVSDGSIAGKGVALLVEPGQTVHSVRSSGLRTVVTARRKVRVRIDLLVTRRAARGLGLSRRLLGAISGEVDYNERLAANVSLSRAARRALRARTTLDATLRLTLLRQAPNRVLRQPMRLPN